MLRSSVEQFARERIGPKVRRYMLLDQLMHPHQSSAGDLTSLLPLPLPACSMDEKSELEPALVKDCFEQGTCSMLQGALRVVSWAPLGVCVVLRPETCAAMQV
jgi:hypothetical protein